MRVGHTATLLKSGKVLIAGGSFLNTAELYSPTKGSWSSGGTMPSIHTDHTATLLSDGEVFVTGGLGQGSAQVADAALYRPSTGSWSATQPMATARDLATANLLPSGEVIVAGGYGGSYLSPSQGYPAIVATVPSAATVGGSVTITGRYLSGAMSVLFGGVPASFTVNNDDQITATVPTGSLTGPSSISTPVGTSWSSTNFKVTPHIIGFSPTSGPAGTIVTITGSAFTGATRVKFNGISAGFLIKSYTKIRTTVPAQATTGSIAVTTPGGTAISGSSFTVT